MKNYILFAICIISGLSMFSQSNSTNENEEEPQMIRAVDTKPISKKCLDLKASKQEECTQMEMINHVANNLKYPKDQNGINLTEIQGTVYVQFDINKEGNPDNVMVRRGLGPLFDQAAIDAVLSLPNMIPATMGGENVAMRYNIPVRFEAR